MTQKEKILLFLWNQVIQKLDVARLAKQTPAPGIETWCDLAYLADGHPMHRLDVYRPANGGPLLPVIIDVHGGGWMYGDKELNKNYCMELASRGFVVFNISYRLVPEVRLQEQLQDVFAAYKWIGLHCGAYGGAVEQICLTGDSAGGHLSALSILVSGDQTMEKELQLTASGIRFCAAGLTSPVVDLQHGVMRQMRPVLLGKSVDAPVLRYLDFAQVYTGQALPPVYIVTSKQDFVRSQAARLHDLLQLYSAEHQYHDWTGETTKKLPHVFSVAEPGWEESIATINEMTACFRRWLLKKETAAAGGRGTPSGE